MEGSDAFSNDEDEEDYEEAGGENRWLGFIFGNVDCSGDLDVDYLDEDAKEHLSALADKLGPALTEIDMSTKLSHTLVDVSEQDYDKKAEDAVDYEDIEEQYEGPEIQANSEEQLMPHHEYMASGTSLTSLEHGTLFDEENYDEDDIEMKTNETVNEINEALAISRTDSIELLTKEDTPSDNIQASVSIQVVSTNMEQIDAVADDLNDSSLHPDLVLKEPSTCDEYPPVESFDTENEVVVEESEDDEASTFHDSLDSEQGTLPILCIEDGSVILRFSEIFGVHEPIKKGGKRDRQIYSISKERLRALDSYGVDDDEEEFLKGTSQISFVSYNPRPSQDDSINVKNGIKETMSCGFYDGQDMVPSQVDYRNKYFSLSALPMKETVEMELFGRLETSFCSLDLEEWEDEIVWEYSPEGSPDSELKPERFSSRVKEPDVLRDMDSDETDHNFFLQSCQILIEPFGSVSSLKGRPFSQLEKPYHPQILRLESDRNIDDSFHSDDEKDINTKKNFRCEAFRKFNKLCMQNEDLLADSWLSRIIWDSNDPLPKPKLILDLQDKQMLFEVSDSKDDWQLHLHAGAMMVSRSSKPNLGDGYDNLGLSGPAVGRFNISNDKYYLNRKNSQQSKSHSKKRASHGVKVMHSVPALRLQTMKPKLSNKDIANFHKPKALWYPHDNEVVAKEQGKLATQGPMKILLRSMGGKGSRLHVNAEETISSVKGKASKKLDFRSSEKVKVLYSGKELEDDKSLASQNVRPNSVLHLVQTKVHLWPKAQKVPGENKPLRPPGAFKKKSELSVKIGRVFLMEYCEERPLILGNSGMGARLCTYYQKVAPGDQTATSLRAENNGLGHILALDPTDKSPFLGDIKPGCTQSCLETNMFRAPIFPHKVSSTDYLLVRSAKGKLSLRRIDRIHVVGQQEPHIEVLSPGSKALQTYLGNRLLVYVYREFRAKEKPGFLPCVRADELSAQFPISPESFLRKRLKHCADLQGANGQLFWVLRRNFRIPPEEELRRMVTPESVRKASKRMPIHF